MKMIFASVHPDYANLHHLFLNQTQPRARVQILKNERTERVLAELFLCLCGY